jgi:hypothetical protein
MLAKFFRFKKTPFLKNEKYFDFLKMDKKNVQNPIAKKVLTDRKFPYDSKKLSSQNKP